MCEIQLVIVGDGGGLELPIDIGTENEDIESRGGSPIDLRSDV